MATWPFVLPGFGADAPDVVDVVADDLGVVPAVVEVDPARAASRAPDVADIGDLEALDAHVVGS